MKSKIFVFIFVLFVCFAIFSCQRAQETEEVEEVMDLSQARTAIEQANIEFGKAVSQGDAAALAGLYTDDARLLPPNSEMIQGKQGIKTFWAGVFQMGIKEAVLTTGDVLGMGDLVCEIGEYDLTIQPEEQEAIKDHGKYLVIWKKGADGTWKLHVDIWNTSLPAQ